MVITAGQVAMGARRRCRKVVPCNPASVLCWPLLYDIDPLASRVVVPYVPWVVIHETFSLVPTQIMDAQPLAAV